MFNMNFLSPPEIYLIRCKKARRNCQKKKELEEKNPQTNMNKVRNINSHSWRRVNSNIKI